MDLESASGLENKKIESAALVWGMVFFLSARARECDL